MEIGRNDTCPCGSGKKYKKCCMEKDEAKVLAEKTKAEKVKAEKPKVPTPAPWSEGPRTSSGKGGNSPSPIPEELIDEKMGAGYRLIAKQKFVEGCRVWLELWDMVKAAIPAEIKNVDDTLDWNPDGECIPNWCQDLEMELANAASDDPSFHQKRLQFCQEFCSIFPESYEMSLHGMKRAIGESYFAMGELDKGEAAFRSLIEEYPNNAWSYIGWGDIYLWPRKNVYPQDLDRAEEIYKMFKPTDPYDKEAMEERFEALKEERKKLNSEKKE